MVLDAGRGAGRGAEAAEVEPRRSPLDPGEYQVPDRAEAHSAHLQGGLHRHMQDGEIEGLQQPQHLHVLAPARLEQSRIHQSPQGLELVPRLPVCQRRRLIEGADLLLQKRQVVDGTGKTMSSRPYTPGMAVDDVAAAADDNLIDVAPDPHVTVYVGDWYRVVVGLVAHQRLRTYPTCHPVARPRNGAGGNGIIAPRSRWRRSPIVSQWPRRVSVRRFAVLLLQPGVEVVPTSQSSGSGTTGLRRAQTTSALHASLVAALPGAAVAILDRRSADSNSRRTAQPASASRPAGCAPPGSASPS